MGNNDDIGSEEKKATKLQKNNHFNTIKPKTLIAIIAIAGAIIGGIGIVKNINNGKLNVTNPNFNQGNKITQNIKENIADKFKITDYDRIVTVSFNNPNEYDEYDISNISVENDNHYNVELGDGKIINASLENAVLLDVDYKERDKEKLPAELNIYDNAIVSFYNDLKQIPVTAISLETINDQKLFVCDTGQHRLMQTVINTVPFRELEQSEVSSYYNDEEILGAVIIIDGKPLFSEKFIGYNYVFIGEEKFVSICAKQDNGRYYEYLAKKEQVVFFHKKQDIVRYNSGKKLPYGKATGNFNFGYRDNPHFYWETKNDAVFLEKDNMYLLDIEARFEIIASPKFYSLDYMDNMPEYKFDNEVKKLPQYMFRIHKQDNIRNPVITAGVQLSRVGDTYLYFLTGGTFKYRRSDQKIRKLGGTICSPNSTAIATYTEPEQLSSEYVKIDGDVEFIANLNGNQIGIYKEDSDLRFYAYKQMKIYNIDYYSLIIEKTDVNSKKVAYLDILVPKKNVIIKGVEEKMGPTMVLNKVR